MDKDIHSIVQCNALSAFTVSFDVPYAHAKKTLHKALHPYGIKHKATAKLYPYWNDTHLHLEWSIQGSVEECFLPHVENGDGVELLIAYRQNLWHFALVPKDVHGTMTAVRKATNRDQEPEKHYSVRSVCKTDGYILYMTMECALFGVEHFTEGMVFPFCCVVHRRTLDSERFGLTDDYPLAQYPPLWLQMILTKGSRKKKRA